jgi:hypothetical protein
MTDVAQLGIPVRLLGGVGIALRCPIARAPGPLAREFSDLDFVARRSVRKGLKGVLVDHGFRSVERFNAANGQDRMMFEYENGMHADVFVDTFAMCHTLELSKRLTIDEATLPLADLLLTKLQIARLTQKDVVDTTALLVDHGLGDSDDDLNVDYITGLLAQDWGWWRTVTENLAKLSEELPGLELEPSQARAVELQAKSLVEAIEGRPKSLRWRARARVGDRLPWRDEPEELG